MNKKSQGLSINAIIVAVIALIVLVVLVAIFTGRIGIFSKGVGEAGSCDSFGGTCDSDCDTGEVRSYGASGCENDDICCVPEQT
ncbi:MAG: hypothetical protein QF436_03150 [Candidatus Woesearchaeota archaeon]|jgi:hypothetical protein|nr:hypothetical protein [Candidatus Woesearchaeota archaeon]MDP7623086.1 hypothetical protein [Candidatus Woesearchaeota archaeon]|tara:strand:+ start:9868 stop:10119 length:252 start_codon:yes stop_codon:yes gene_type:complete